MKTDGPGGGSVRSIVVSGTDLFAGTYGGGVFLSNDKGASWTAVSSGLPLNTTVTAFAVNGSNLFGGAGGVFRSTDNGTSRYSLEDESAEVKSHCKSCDIRASFSCFSEQ